MSKTMQNTSEQPTKISFFLFINTKSGGGLGKRYLTVPNKRLDYKCKLYSNIALHFIDLFDADQREKELYRLNMLVNKHEKQGNHQCRVVICGGDGTVLWVVSLVSAAKINIDKIAFCIIPIGTGNDFSRCLGWGGSPISFSQGNVLRLKQRIVEWLEADEKWYDIWQSTVTTYADGTIIQIRDKRQVDTKQQILERGICNYFGIGIDARICYSVEMRRQSCKLINLVLYGCIGLCKLFKRIRPTNEAIQQFKQYDQSSEGREDSEGIKQFHSQQINGVNTSRHSPLLETKGRSIQLKEGYGNLLALNSVRFMAGLKNVWNTSKIGIKTKSPPQFAEQSFDDGKIQFLAFKNELRLGLERFVNSAARVAQGQGPFTLLFNRTDNETPTFIQIDGEAIKVKQLKQVTIRKSILAPEGRIRVMVRRQES